MTTRVLGLAPTATLVVSFAIVFGLGKLIGPAVQDTPPPPSTTIQQVPAPTEPESPPVTRHRRPPPNADGGSGTNQQSTPAAHPRQGDQ